MFDFSSNLMCLYLETDRLKQNKTDWNPGKADEAIGPCEL